MPIVEEGLLRALAEETNRYTRLQEFRTLRGCGDREIQGLSEVGRRLGTGDRRVQETGRGDPGGAGREERPVSLAAGLASAIRRAAGVDLGPSVLFQYMCEQCGCEDAESEEPRLRCESRLGPRVLPLFEPAPQRGLAFHRRFSRQETLRADVLIEIGPVNAAAVADQTPVVAFLRGTVKEPRIPGERYRERAAIGQRDDQLIVGDLHVRYHAFQRISRGRTHSSLPVSVVGSELRVVRSD